MANDQPGPNEGAYKPLLELPTCHTLYAIALDIVAEGYDQTFS